MNKMTEIFANEILFNLFKLDIDIPEWGEVGVFEFRPFIRFNDVDGIWDSKETRGKTTKYKLLYWEMDYSPFPELQIISVKDLLST